MIDSKRRRQPGRHTIASDDATGSSAACAVQADGIELLCGEILGNERLSEPMRLSELDGVFACVLRSGDRSWAYRDPSGLCCLFARRQRGGGWHVAGSLAALADAAQARPEIERLALHEYLRLLDIAAPNAWFRGTRSIEPGQLFGLEAGTPADNEEGTEPATSWPGIADFGEATLALERRLHASTVRCLSGTSRPGAFLSGGIDSALVCAMAAQCAEELTAVTVGFDGLDFDEAPVAARIAAHLGLDHHVLRFGRNEYLAAFNRLAHGMDQPMADPATMATLLAFEHCCEFFDVVLDGSGAEAGVGVMPPRHVRVAVGVGSLVPAPIRRVLVGVMSRIPWVAGYTPILDFEHPAETLMRWKGFTRTEIEALCAQPVSLEDTTFYRTFARFPRRAHFERCSALDDVMPSDRLTQAMRLTGLRVRFPFLARDVGGFMRQLPTPWRHSPGQPKRILRELLARYVPREIWDQPKQGFTFPLHEFLAGDGYALVHRHVLEGRWLRLGLLQADEVRRHAQQYLAGDRRSMFKVWALVVLGAWLDAHEEVACPALPA